MIIATLWAGLLLGVSFLATPAKFLAPSLSLPVALDVGRHTFSVFNRVEWLLAIILVPPVVALRTPSAMLAAALLGLVLVAETFWLLPVLDLRVGMIMAGQSPAATSHHALYVAAEIAKLVVLGCLVFDMTRRLLRPGN